MKNRAFFFHFNKPASRAAGRPQITLHTCGKCFIVDNVVCSVPTFGRIDLKRQPHFCMCGRGVLTIDNRGNVAHISNVRASSAVEVVAYITRKHV